MKQPHWWVPSTDPRFMGYSELGKGASVMPAIRVGRWIMCQGGFTRKLKWREYIRCKLGRKVFVTSPSEKMDLPLWKVDIGYESGITAWTWRRAATAKEAIEMVKASPTPPILSITATRA